jgi:hypothetical protein
LLCGFTLKHFHFSSGIFATRTHHGANDNTGDFKKDKRFQKEKSRTRLLERYDEENARISLQKHVMVNPVFSAKTRNNDFADRARIAHPF